MVFWRALLLISSLPKDRVPKQTNILFCAGKCTEMRGPRIYQKDTGIVRGSNTQTHTLLSIEDGLPKFPLHSSSLPISFVSPLGSWRFLLYF